MTRNIPVFFIQDAMKFPDLIHAVKQEPDRGFPQAQSAHDNFWDFVSLVPESTHMLMWAMSDRAIPRSFRFMEGFGVHTFRFVNEAGRSTYVKFHWKPKQGLQSVVWNEAVKINGADPDFHRRDLWDAINSGDYPEWELGLQLFDDEFADQFEFDVLDPTKIIPEEQLPVRPVGRLVLDRVVDNFFAETEQVAFCTQNIVPGIDFTNDPLLQGRNFSYLDTQLKRLGSPNFTQLPVNAPKCPVAHFQQDGHMARSNPVTRANYEPNSWSGAEGGPREDPAGGYRSYPEEVAGAKRRLRPESFADHYSQARQFYLSQTDFTNDPLLQGRNFSYLDTQLKRLGSPNFTQLPVNAPKCPVAHFQQDGHMARSNPVTRANYEPNSWSGAEGGPREDPAGGYRSYPEEVAGAKRRLRPESFADHYSQARQFYLSQTGVERRHIADAFTFELSKCERVEIRARMVAGLRNVDEELAAMVAEGLGLRELPAPVEPARQPRHDLPESPALSILRRGPGDFKGRKIGVLVTNGADAETLAALRAAAAAERAQLEIVSPAVGGVEISDGSRVTADQQIDGAPSVLYDAVAIVAESGGARALAARPPARDFVTDAVAHCKFIGYTSGAAVLFEAAGLPTDPSAEDDGFMNLSDHPATEFIGRCRQLRFWDRQFAGVS